MSQLILDGMPWLMAGLALAILLSAIPAPQPNNPGLVMHRKLRHMWHVITGRFVILQYDPDEGVFIVAIPANVQTSLDALTAAAARVVAKDATAGIDPAVVAQDNADTAAAIDGVTAQLNTVPAS